METFSALLAICAGNSPVPGEFPPQRPVTRSFDVFFDLRLNKRLSKHWWGWWFETLSRSLWRHRNVLIQCNVYIPTGKIHQHSVLLVFVKKIHYSAMDSPHKQPENANAFPFLDIIISVLITAKFYCIGIFVISLNKLLNNESSCQWFETRWSSCDVKSL